MSASRIPRLGFEPRLPAMPGGAHAQASAIDRWLGVLSAADQAGFDSVHLPAAGAGADDPDGLTLAGGVAAACSLTVGVLSDVAAGRHPAVLCRDVITLDVVSGGRAALTLFDSAIDRSDGDPWGRLGEAAALCRALLTRDHAPASGPYFRVGAVNDRPRPLRPGGPVLLAHLGPADVVRAAAHADNPDGGLARCLRSVDAVVAEVGPEELPPVRAAIAGASRAAGLGRGPGLVWRAPALEGSLPAIPASQGARPVARRSDAPGAPADGIIVRSGPEAPSPGALRAVARWWLDLTGSA